MTPFLFYNDLYLCVLGSPHRAIGLIWGVVQKRLERNTLINNKRIYLYILQNFENKTRLTAGLGRFLHLFIKGDRGSTVVKALCYKSERR